jgi:hypothetical protein
VNASAAIAGFACSSREANHRSRSDSGAVVGGADTAWAMSDSSAAIADQALVGAASGASPSASASAKMSAVPPIGPGTRATTVSAGDAASPRST